MLSDADRRLCLQANTDPDILDLVDDDVLYTIGDLAEIFKCDRKSMQRGVDGIPGIFIGRARGWRIMGSTFKRSIIARIRSGKPPLN